jgi:hypothetical protein
MFWRVLSRAGLFRKAQHSMKTSELTGAQLDYAVARCENRTIMHDPMGFRKDAPESPQAGKSIYMLIGGDYSPSTKWAQGGPIIEREKITLDVHNQEAWLAEVWDGNGNERAFRRGSTALEAAMRCRVSSKFGNEVEIPEELR